MRKREIGEKVERGKGNDEDGGERLGKGSRDEIKGRRAKSNKKRKDQVECKDERRKCRWIGYLELHRGRSGMEGILVG